MEKNPNCALRGRQSKTKKYKNKSEKKNLTSVVCKSSIHILNIPLVFFFYFFCIFLIKQTLFWFLFCFAFSNHLHHY